jgi:hypothetical protein
MAWVDILIGGCQMTSDSQRTGRLAHKSIGLPILQRATLPKYLIPFESDSLVRLGRKNDGGYMVAAEDISKADVLVSFGVNDDWSFEEQFLAQNPVPLFAFDSSMGLQKFMKAFKRSIPFGLKSTSRHWQTVKAYKSFFQGNRVHVKKFVGIDRSPNHISLKTVFADLSRQSLKKAFLKIDIEGWEYRILDDLLSNSNLIAGATIEFHDVDLHQKRIDEFIKAWPLALVHTHCNNFAQIADDGTPMVVECSFSSFHTGRKKVTQLPHDLDQSNNRKIKDYAVTLG